MSRTRYAIIVLALFAVPVLGDDAPGTIKKEKVAPPKELKEPFQSLLSDEAYQLVDDKGAAWATFWFRKAVPAKAAAEQVKNGLTYREIPQTTLIGAVQFAQPWTDFRKQKIPAGVYTLRMALQ